MNKLINQKRICLYCKKKYIPKTGNQLFCCNRCSTIYRGLYPYREIPKTILKYCIQCSKEFLSNNKKKAYCSDKCQIIHRENSYKKIKKSKKICFVCLKEFNTSSWIQRYCSKECYLKNKRDNKNE